MNQITGKDTILTIDGKALPMKEFTLSWDEYAKEKGAAIFNVNPSHHLLDAVRNKEAEATTWFIGLISRKRRMRIHKKAKGIA